LIEVKVGPGGVQTKEAEALLRLFVDRSGGLYARAYWLDEKGGS